MDIKKYLKDMQNKALGAFNDYKNTLGAVEKAQKDYESYHQLNGTSDLQYQFDKNRLKEKVIMLEDKAKNYNFVDMLREVKAIANKAFEEIQNEYKVSLESVKSVNIETLKILSLTDLVELYNQSDNYTEKEAIYRILDTERIAEIENAEPEVRTAVYNVLDEQRRSGESETGLIESMLDIISRCANNKAMISHFEELTALLLEE